MRDTHTALIQTKKDDPDAAVRLKSKFEHFFGGEKVPIFTVYMTDLKPLGKIYDIQSMTKHATNGVLEFIIVEHIKYLALSLLSLALESYRNSSLS